jgi:hypothetical protein
MDILLRVTGKTAEKQYNASRTAMRTPSVFYAEEGLEFEQVEFAYKYDMAIVSLLLLQGILSCGSVKDNGHQSRPLSHT